MQTIYIDVSSKGVIPTLYTKQGDIGRKFVIVFTENGANYSIPTGAMFSAWYKGDSGEGNYTDIGESSAFSVSGNRVTVELIYQMLATPGSGFISIVLTKPSGGQIGSWNIPYICEEIPGFGSETATEYYTAFSKALEDLRKNPDNVVIDKTLSMVGAAADAYETGDAIRKAYDGAVNRAAEVEYFANEVNDGLVALRESTEQFHQTTEGKMGGIEETMDLMQGNLFGVQEQVEGITPEKIGAVAQEKHDTDIGELRGWAEDEIAIQVESLEEQIADVKEEIYSLPFEIIEGKYINSKGNEVADLSFCATGYIRITHNVKILTYVGDDNSRHAFYDKDMNFISAENDGAHSGVLTALEVPENTRYIRVSCWKNQSNILVIKSGPINDRFIAQQDATDTIAPANYKFTPSAKNGFFVSSFQGSEGLFPADEWSCITGYVRVIPNHTIKISGLYLSGNRSVCAYDKDKNFIEVLCSGTTDTEITVKVGKTTEYICATGKKSTGAPTFEYLNIVPSLSVEERHKLNNYKVLFENATKKPVVSIIDDDTWSITAVTAFRNKCTELGIKGSYACLTSRLEADENTGIVDLLLGYEREGFPVLTHGHTQGEFYKNDANRDLAACENDLVTGLQKLYKHGFTDYKCCWSVPYGYYDADLQSLAKKWGFESLVCNLSYKAEEPMWHNAELPSELSPNRRYEIRRIQFTNKDTLDALKVIVDEVVKQNGWFIVTTHFAQPANSNIDFLGGENADGTIVKGAFAEFVEYAKGAGCEFRTFNEELRNRMPIYNAYEKY